MAGGSGTGMLLSRHFAWNTSTKAEAGGWKPAWHMSEHMRECSKEKKLNKDDRNKCGP